MNRPDTPLKWRATIDFLKMLSAIVRKYGIDSRIEITNEDLQAPKGAIRRDIDGKTGTSVFWFEYDLERSQMIRYHTIEILPIVERLKETKLTLAFKLATIALAELDPTEALKNAELLVAQCLDRIDRRAEQSTKKLEEGRTDGGTHKNRGRDS